MPINYANEHSCKLNDCKVNKIPDQSCIVVTATPIKCATKISCKIYDHNINKVPDRLCIIVTILSCKLHGCNIVKLLTRLMSQDFMSIVHV